MIANAKDADMMEEICCFARHIADCVEWMNAIVTNLLRAQSEFVCSAYNVLICPVAVLVYVGIGIFFISAIFAGFCTLSMPTRIMGWAFWGLLTAVGVYVLYGFIFGSIKFAVLAYAIVSILSMGGGLAGDAPAEKGSTAGNRKPSFSGAEKGSTVDNRKPSISGKKHLGDGEWVEPDGIKRFHSCWFVGLGHYEIPEDLNPRFLYKYKVTEGRFRRYHRVLETVGVPNRGGFACRTHYFIFYQRRDECGEFFNTKTLKLARLYKDEEGYYVEETFDSWDDLE